MGGTAREAEQAQRGLRGAEERQAEVAGRFGEVEAAVTRRETWMAEHPTEVNWQADLSEQVAARRRDLALSAERHPSPHVLRLVGPPPLDDDARERWLTSAGAVEAYREQWRVEPDRIGREESLRGAQALAWEDAELQLESGPPELDWLRCAHPAPDRGLGLEL